MDDKNQQHARAAEPVKDRTTEIIEGLRDQALAMLDGTVVSVKGPSDIMDAVISYGKACAGANATATELCTRLQEIRILLHHYGQPAASAQNDAIEDRAHELVWDAAQAGMLVRIDLVPRKPLAMGNVQMVVDVRPVRLQPTLATAQPEYTAEEDEAWRELERKADRCLQPGDRRTKGE